MLLRPPSGFPCQTPVHDRQAERADRMSSSAAQPVAGIGVLGSGTAAGPRPVAAPTVGRLLDQLLDDELDPDGVEVGADLWVCSTSSRPVASSTVSGVSTRSAKARAKPSPCSPMPTSPVTAVPETLTLRPGRRNRVRWRRRRPSTAGCNWAHHANGSCHCHTPGTETCRTAPHFAGPSVWRAAARPLRAAVRHVVEADPSPKSVRSGAACPVAEFACNRATQGFAYAKRVFRRIGCRVSKVRVRSHIEMSVSGAPTPLPSGAVPHSRAGSVPGRRA